MNAHPNHPAPLRNARRRGAFTLIEMLLVVVILAVLLATATPSLLGILKGTRLTSTGDNLLNQLAEAQLTAISECTDVEVRIYEALDHSMPSSTPQMRAVQLFALRPVQDVTNNVTDYEAAFQPATPVLHLDHGVVISKEKTLSSLMELTLKEPPDDRAPGRYTAFRFHSDGSTDLVPDKPWFLTLVDENQADSAVAPPNYFTIQLDPATGKARTFRP